MDTELRPLSLGEILDRVFHLYRSHFLMFVGIATLPAGLDLLWRAAQTVLTRMLIGHIGAAALGVAGTGLVLIQFGVYVVISALAMAATSRAVSAIYLGQPTGIFQSYREVKSHWFRYVLLFVVAWLLAWGVPLLIFFALIAAAAFAGTAAGAQTGTLMTVAILGLGFFFTIPLGVWLTLRYSLVNQASVFEDLKIRASLKRSVFLTKGALLKLRIFVLLLLVFVIMWVLSFAGAMPVLFVTVKAIQEHHAAVLSLGLTIYTLLVSFVTTSLTLPLYAIGLTLMYYDTRIRKEGFDVQWMMLRAGVPEPEDVLAMPVTSQEPALAVLVEEPLPVSSEPPLLESVAPVSSAESVPENLPLAEPRQE